MHTFPIRTALASVFCICFWGTASEVISATSDKLGEYQRQYRDSNAETRLRAVGLLSNLGADAIPTLADALRDEDRMVRYSAERALLKIGPDALPALDRMLDDSHFEAPGRAAHAIVWMGPVAAETIIKVLQEYRPDAWNRLYESSNISNLPKETKEALVPRLVALLTHHDNEVRVRAMLYMGYMKPASQHALPQIVEALKGDAILQSKAARVLYGIGKPATSFLVQALQDPNPEIRQLVIDMLSSPAFSREVAKPGLEQVCSGDSALAIRQRAQAILHHTFRKSSQSVC